MHDHLRITIMWFIDSDRVWDMSTLDLRNFTFRVALTSPIRRRTLTTDAEVKYLLHTYNSWLLTSGKFSFRH